MLVPERLLQKFQKLLYGKVRLSDNGSQSAFGRVFGGPVVNDKT